MADEQPKPSRVKSLFKVVFGSFIGLCTGALMMYANVIFDKVVKPPKPVANFSVGSTDGLTATLQNMASGQSGWWDFGDGSPLEPFDAEKTQVTHAYPKAGSYKVSLTVRNFLNEENDRSISVDVTAPAVATAVGGVPSELPPTVKGWKVEAVGGTQAPATFHVTGELENADEVIWRLGNDKTEQLTAQSGPIDKYVRIDQPGQQHIVLTAISKSSKQPQVLVHAVNIQPQKTAVYTATLNYTDSAERVDPVTRRENVPLLVGDKSGATKGFNRVIKAMPNSTIQSITLDKNVKSVVRKESVKIVIAPDKLSATVTGEWSQSGDALLREAGGSDVPLPLVITESRVTRLSPRTNRLSGTLDNKQQIIISMPPAPPAGVKRTMSIDFDLLVPEGSNSKRTPVASGPLDTSGNWSSKVKLGGQEYTIQARTVNNQVVITFK